MEDKTILELIALQRHGTRAERRAAMAEQARRFVLRKLARARE